ncbi:STAS domain-containing protein [Actinoplanes sp. DH11]|uniref:STAS domain-containing protein n=1 Tax=Actinoplanes sp. DH11 TaxID=2857011 RepID=UPI001E3B9574|nr:STAS domain-containing protein [Actinoplanes sp. DH11]
MDPTAAHQSGSDPTADGGSGSDWLRVDVITSTATGMVRLILTGELDRTTAEHLHHQVVLALRGAAPATLDIDAGGLSFLDSSGIRSLLLCRNDAEAAGSRLVVTNPARIPYQVLEISGLLELFASPRTPPWPSPPGGGAPPDGRRRTRRQPRNKWSNRHNSCARPPGKHASEPERSPAATRGARRHPARGRTDERDVRRNLAVGLGLGLTPSAHRLGVMPPRLMPMFAGVGRFVCGGAVVRPLGEFVTARGVQVRAGGPFPALGGKVSGSFRGLRGRHGHRITGAGEGA